MAVETPSSHIERRLLILLCAAFVVFGLRSGTQGISLVYAFQDETAVTMSDALSQIYLASAVGSVVAALGLAWLLSRLGYNRTFIIGAAMSGLGLLGWALNPPWPSPLGLELLVSTGQTLITLGAVVYLATLGTTRQLIWLYVFSALGAMVGSVLFGIIFALTDTALSVYLVLLLLSGALLILFVLARLRWHTVMPAGDAIWFYDVRQTARAGSTWWFVGLLLTTALLQQAVVQVQMQPGLYSTTDSASTIGLWLSISSLARLVALIIYGVITPRLHLSERLISTALSGALLGILMLFLLPGAGANLGLVITQFFVAPLFVLFIWHTRTLLGTYHLPGILGLQSALSMAAMLIISPLFYSQSPVLVLGGLLLVTAGFYTLTQYQETLKKKKTEVVEAEDVPVSEG